MGGSTAPIPAEDWERHYSAIKKLYIKDDMSLEAVRQEMISDHGFHAT
jgi:hypothetical protein